MYLENVKRLYKNVPNVLKNEQMCTEKVDIKTICSKNVSNVFKKIFL